MALAAAQLADADIPAEEIVAAPSSHQREHEHSEAAYHDDRDAAMSLGALLSIAYISSSCCRPQ